jgi:hypothetical protein
MAYNFVTVQGKYQDGSGNAAVGRVEWFPTNPIVDTALHVTIAPPVTQLSLDSTGMFAAVLLATDNANIGVFGWAFIPHIAGVPDDTQYMQVKFASGATQQLDTLPVFLFP